MTATAQIPSDDTTTSQAPLPRTLQQLDQSPAAFGAEIMTHNLILENGLMSWHEMRPVQEQPGLAWLHDNNCCSKK